MRPQNAACAHRGRHAVRPHLSGPRAPAAPGGHPDDEGVTRRTTIVTAVTPATHDRPCAVASPTPGGARRAHLRELRRESLWFWPAVAAIAAWVGGDLAARRPATASRSIRACSPPTSTTPARCSPTIATALLTFTGVVFSITLVALQMASTQYSPRVLRTFVRKPVTKLALSTFIATFVYSLTLLARVGTAQAAPTRVPQGAVGLAYLLVMVSIIVFVFFVHSTVRSMRVTYVIEAVFRETLPLGDEHVRRGSASYVDVRAPHRDLAVTARIALRPRRRRARWHRRPPPGPARRGARVRAAPDRARRHVRAPGLRDHRGARPPLHARPAPRSLRNVHTSAVRTMYQDPNYGVRQLVDIAIRALSPAINDPTTAVQALDRLHGVLRPSPPAPTHRGTTSTTKGACA